MGEAKKQPMAKRQVVEDYKDASNQADQFARFAPNAPGLQAIWADQELTGRIQAKGFYPHPKPSYDTRIELVTDNRDRCLEQWGEKWGKPPTMDALQLHLRDGDVGLRFNPNKL